VQDAHAALNAALNFTSGVVLFSGWVAIKRGNPTRHKQLMLTALAISAVFLVSYLIRFFGAGGTTRFPDVGWVRSVYLVILLTHTVLAALVPFLALRTVFLAWKERWESHKRLARWTFPIWIYVSVTGVVIYGMLYHLAPALAGT
jgi:putative membrane protein